MSAPTIARVEPLLTTRSVRGPFDYRVPDSMRGELAVGSVLVVPFGHRRLTGVVVGLADRSDVPGERLAEPIEALDAGVEPELAELGLWVASEYCSTPARGLELVLAPGTARDRRAAPRREVVATITAAGREAPAGAERLGTRQRAALERLAAGPGNADRPESMSAATLGVTTATLVSLERRGLVELGERRVSRRPATVAVGDRRVIERPNPAQAEAIARIARGFDSGGAELLLHGVTGSGKTEVYLAAAAAALERGRGAIILVPEIALTPQTVSRFEARFGERVAILHSGLSAGERGDEWRRLRAGEARICVGPRSAVFAPIDGLGLIVVDEEHDSSYKQESDPRYDARHVARRRAAMAGAVLVFGSATPRPESWTELERIKLPERADGAPLPPVEVLDMRERDGREGPLHARTRAALSQLAATGGKAIVLVPRRGWSPFVDCRDCGQSWRCPRCDVSLVLHRSGERLRCHHCGHAEPAPHRCEACGSTAVGRHGAGSERIGAIVERLVAPHPVFRMDADTTAARGAHGRVLAAFEAAPAGVLIGTQMVAKGHDFPDVVLAVVVDADSSLRFPDFRAEERTFALVAQLAGRCGRGPRGGSVLVQTLAPGATAIEAAARHDAEAFIAAELPRREELGYPPYATVIRVDVAAAEARRADEVARLIAARIRGGAPPGATVLGPAPRFRLRDRERRQILVKTTDREAAIEAVRDAIDQSARGRGLTGTAVAADVDPA